MHKFSIFLLSLILLPNLAFASEFNPDHIISDSKMLDKDTMSLTEIQRFLEAKDSYLVNYFDRDFYGNVTSADEIIYNASQDYGVNPQVLLVMLQKEQSLIENDEPSEYNLDWAMGWHRPDGSDPSDPALQKYKGFGMQVDGAAGLLGWYMEQHDLPNYFLKKAGETYDIDNTEVTPVNKATAALYNYTPHLHGNSNFTKIWDRYFSTEVLNGSLVQVKGEAGVWLIENNKRRPFASKTALITRYNPNLIIPIEQSDLEKYPIGQEIKFAQYALLRIPTGGIYMIDGDYKRPITSMEAFKSIGFNMEEVEDVEVEELANIPNGDPITTETSYPAGALLQDSATGAVYYATDGKKYGIVDRSILNLKFANQRIIQTTPEVLNKYLTVGPVKFNDGELVSPVENKSVYVIENGFKRPIVSGEIFENLGYKWSNIVQVPEKVLSRLHQDGSPVDFN